MQHPDEGTIHAWLDGALTPAEASEVETHAASCAQCREAVAEARGLIAASSRIVTALDAVPAGVIPARKRVARPWYASTPLRAAAAVVFVAGASMLLFNRPGSKSLNDISQRVVEAPAAEVAAPDVSTQAEQDEVRELSSAAKSAPAENRAVEAPRSTAKRSAGTDEFQGRGMQGEAARVGSVTRAGNTLADAAQAPAAAPAPATLSSPLALPPAPPADADRLAASKSIPVSPVVVTGVATGAQEIAAADLRILGVDSTSARRITRYRIATGAELVLTETPMSGRGTVAMARGRRFDGAKAQAAPPPPPAPAAAMPPPATSQAAARAEAASEPPVEILTWVDASSGRTYTLSGRVSKETLEQVKARLQLPGRQPPE